MEILRHALTLAGIADEQQKAILENEALKAIVVPDDLTVKVKNALTTIENAKAHPDVANHFKGRYYGVVDKAIKEALSEIGMDDAGIKEVVDGIKTDERFKKAIAKANKIGLSKAGQSNDVQLEELRTLLKATQESTEAQRTQYESKLHEQSTMFEQLNYKHSLSSALSDSGLRFMPLPPEVLSVSANHLINAKLAEIGAVAKSENGRIKLVRADDKEQAHYTGAVATDFYALLPTILDSIIDKTNGGTTKTVQALAGVQVATSRANRAALNNLKTIGQ